MDNAERPDLSIIIVNYNVKEFLANCLQSVQTASNGLKTECIVVDNASEDGSIEFLKPKFPDVRFIENSQNIGFGRANNQALKMASGTYSLLLNPDTLLEEDTLHVLFRHMEKNPKCGACGCKILNPDGTFAPESRRAIPTISTAIYKALGLTSLFPDNKLFGGYYLSWIDEDEAGEVPVLSGSFMFFRTELLKKLNGFDERFFMYGEDIDLCFRVKKSGWRIDYVPETSIIHYKGESTKKGNLTYVRLFNKALYQFFDKHYSSGKTSFFRFLIFLAIQIRTVSSYIFSKLKSSKFVLYDLILLNISLLIGFYVRVGSGELPFWSKQHVEFLCLNLLMSILYLFFAQYFGVFKKNRYSVVSSIKAVLLSFLLLAAITFFIRSLAFSRLILGVSGIVGITCVAITRFLRINSLKHANVARGRFNPSRILIVGVGNQTESIVNQILGRVNWQVEVSGIVHQKNWNNQTKINNIPIIGSLEQLSELVKATRSDLVISLMESVSHTELLQAIKELRNEDVEFRVVPDGMNFMIGKAEIEYLDDVPIYDVDLPYFNLVNRAVKRLFDLLLSCFMLLILTVPALLWQLFNLGSRREFSLYIYDGNKPSKISLRKEAPDWVHYWQLSNYIFGGSLSFVGSDISSSPENVKNQKYKSGLTGYTQINQDRVKNGINVEKFDLYYLQNHSIWLDLDILVKALVQEKPILDHFRK